MSETKEKIENVLKKDQQDIAFEPIPAENISPLAQPVVQKTQQQTQQQQTPPVNPQPAQNAQQNNSQPPPQANKDNAQQAQMQDAPEQEVNEEPDNKQPQFATAEDLARHIADATSAADTILGITNNVLEVGGGYFVTVKKHDEFYEFDEVIQIIEEQNVKNIRRIKLDEEDKALLRPLLITVLQRQKKVATPEQQLLGAVLSIIIKKARIVVEIREENQQMEERILAIIRKERVRDVPEAQEAADSEKENRENETQAQKEDVKAQSRQNNTGLPSEVLETT